MPSQWVRVSTSGADDDTKEAQRSVGVSFVDELMINMAVPPVPRELATFPPQWSNQVLARIARSVARGHLQATSRRIIVLLTTVTMQHFLD